MSDFKPEPIVIATQSFLSDLWAYASTTGPINVDGTVFPFDAFSSTLGYDLCYSPQDATRLLISPFSCAALQGLNPVIYSLFGLLKQNDQPHVGRLQDDLDLALFLAVFSGHRETADLLLDFGANPGREFSSNGLHGAASRGLNEDIRIYVEDYGVPVDVVDKDFATPIVYAMQLNGPHDWDTIKCLFRLGADPETEVGEENWTYVQCARAMGKERLAKRLAKAARLAKATQLPEAACYASISE